LHRDFEQIAYFGASLHSSQPSLDDLVAVLRFGPRLFGFPQAVHDEFHPGLEAVLDGFPFSVRPGAAKKVHAVRP
jgi:hypothetical protein